MGRGALPATTRCVRPAALDAALNTVEGSGRAGQVGRVQGGGAAVHTLAPLARGGDSAPGAGGGRGTTRLESGTRGGVSKKMHGA